MKFLCSVEINKPKTDVVRYFKDPEYLGEYQDTFIKKEVQSGVPGENGTISKMYYRHGKGTMELTETIEDNNLPEYFRAFYHHKHTDNYMTSRFSAISDNVTRYDAEIEYTALRGFMVKVVSKLFPSMFRKQVQKWLDNFKTFVERQ